jgi:hypothetical protein
MTAILIKTVRYYTFVDCSPVELEVGTLVSIDLNDNTACFNGDHFDIEPDEWAVPAGNN